jgi:hypothetical protein
MPEGLLLLLFVWMGAGSWLVERSVQREDRYCGLIVKAPPLVNGLCGNPRRDGTVDLDCAARQLASLVFLVGAPLIFLLPLDLSRRAALVFLGYALLSIPASLLSGWVRWHSSRRRVEELDGARPVRSAR